MDPVTNELPAAVPWMNLAISVLALVGVVWITFTRSQSTRRLLINLTGLTAIAVLTAGAMFQANLLSLDMWVLIGTGGRIGVLVLVALFVFTPEEFDTNAERDLAEDKHFGDQRRELEREHNHEDRSGH